MNAEIYTVIEFCYVLLMNISVFLGGSPEASRPYRKKALIIPWCSFGAVTDYLTVLWRPDTNSGPSNTCLKKISSSQDFKSYCHFPYIPASTLVCLKPVTVGTDYFNLLLPSLSQLLGTFFVNYIVPGLFLKIIIFIQRCILSSLSFSIPFLFCFSSHVNIYVYMSTIKHCT